MDSPVKKGFLLFPPQGVFSHIKKSWQKKYCELYHASKCGIERLEVFDSEDEASTNVSPKIITLENCVKITPDPPKLEPNVFVIVTKSSTYYFSALEDHEKRDWVSAFQIVAFKEIAGGVAIEEDNELYCSSEPSREVTFFVKLVPSDASFRCGLEPGPYTLLLTSSAIQLWDSNQQAQLVTWPYCFIRRYGYCDGKFTFEAGRMCDTGEGKFQVEHPNQQEIYRSLALKMKSMRKMLGGESNSVGQLSVAMSMEARSRSPLPPCPAGQEHPATLRARAASQGNLLESNRPHVSPTVETNPLLVINAPAHLKPRVFSASHGALDLLSRKSPTLFHAKVVDIDLPNEPAPTPQKPAKPPRRSIMAEKVFYWPRNQNPSSSKPTDDYDDVEVREDAWKTLGTSEPNHTEDYEPIEAVETPRKADVVTPFIPPVRPKFLPLKPTSELGNYDTLQYFGSGKLNSSKSVYKQVTLSPTSPDSPISPGVVTPTFHDYDEVADQALVGVRPADDQHQGYGIIRRLPDHKLFNNLEYAIVTKPRQV